MGPGLPVRPIGPAGPLNASCKAKWDMLRNGWFTCPDRWKGASVRGQGQEPLWGEVTGTPDPPPAILWAPSDKHQRGGSRVGAHSPLWGGCPEPWADPSFSPPAPPSAPHPHRERETRLPWGAGWACVVHELNHTFPERHFQRPGVTSGSLQG